MCFALCLCALYGLLQFCFFQRGTSATRRRMIISAPPVADYHRPTQKNGPHIHCHVCADQCQFLHLVRAHCGWGGVGGAGLRVRPSPRRVCLRRLLLAAPSCALFRAPCPLPSCRGRRCARLGGVVRLLVFSALPLLRAFGLPSVRVARWRSALAPAWPLSWSAAALVGALVGVLVARLFLRASPSVAGFAGSSLSVVCLWRLRRVWSLPRACGLVRVPCLARSPACLSLLLVARRALLCGLFCCSLGVLGGLALFLVALSTLLAGCG